MITCLSKHYEINDFPENLDREYYMLSTGINDQEWRKLQGLIQHLNPKFVFNLSFSLVSVKKFGLTSGTNEYPCTFAPSKLSQWVNQPPLKPVWPVTATDLSCQKFSFIPKLSMVPSYFPIVH